MRERVVFRRNTDCVQIPSGEGVEVPEATEGFLIQARSGRATVRIPSRMWQVQLSAEDLDALQKPDGSPLDIELEEEPTLEDVPEDMTEAVYGQLEQCYDPEIPVNIVELGLVYDVTVDQVEEESYDVDVKMTLTARGCGMGDHIAQQAQQKINRIPGVRNGNVDIVWDPPWTEEMMSEEARQQLGFV